MLMKVCGIMVSKEKSNRFPHKNRMLFEDNAKILLQFLGAGNVYMFTDDPVIKEICYQYSIVVISKNVNFQDEFPYIETIKFAYYAIMKQYDYIVSILSNSIGHTIGPIKKGLEIMKNDSQVNDIRSFDEEGNQSGIFIFRANSLPEKLYHQAAILSNGKEIHYQEELNEWNRRK